MERQGGGGDHFLCGGIVSFLSSFLFPISYPPHLNPSPSTASSTPKSPTPQTDLPLPQHRPHNIHPPLRNFLASAPRLRYNLGRHQAMRLLHCRRMSLPNCLLSPCLSSSISYHYPSVCIERATHEHSLGFASGRRWER